MHKFWSFVFAMVIVLGVFLFVLAAITPGWWLPPRVSTVADEVDGLFYLILWITTVTFVLTEAMLVYNIYKFSTPAAGSKAPYVHGNHRLEVIWTIVPAGILILIAVLQISSWERVKYLKYFPKPDSDTCQMVVVARQWEWRVRYPSPAEIRRWDRDPKAAAQWAKLSGYPFEDMPQYDDVHAVNEIHCWAPNDRDKRAPVLVHLKTRDVLHSFFLPTLRIKQDAVPGKVIPVWFELTDYNIERDPRDPKGKRWVYRTEEGEGSKPYEWDLACAEFCGTRHSMMRGHLFVHRNRNDFLAWLEHQQEEQNKGKTNQTAAAPAPATAPAK